MANTTNKPPPQRGSRPQPQQHPNEPPPQQPRSQSSSSSSAPPSSDDREKHRKYLAAQYGYTSEQIEVIRNQICVGATDAELEFFLATAKRVKLDPFARQIALIKRRQKVEDQWGNENWVEVARPETTIDGLRTSAEQTGEYEGQAPILWCDADGNWRDVWLDGTRPPYAARATVFRTNHREPMVRVALFHEYAVYVGKGTDRRLGAMWSKMGSNQIAKCAEAAALRAAFPRDLSGLYIDAELEHTSAGYEAPAIPSAVKVAPPVIESREAKIAADPDGPHLDASFAAEIDQLRQQVANAKSRADLAPVGKRCDVAKRDQTGAPINQAIREHVTPLLTERWRELPP